MREILLASLMLTAACSGPPAESPPTSTNRVEVLGPQGEPGIAVAVVVHDASGAEVWNYLTGSDGAVAVKVPVGGSVSAFQRAQVGPAYMDTAIAPPAGAVVRFRNRLALPQPGPLRYRFLVDALLRDVPAGVSHVDVLGACQGSWSPAMAGPNTLECYANPGVKSGLLLVRAMDPSGQMVAWSAQTLSDLRPDARLQRTVGAWSTDIASVAIEVSGAPTPISANAWVAAQEIQNSTHYAVSGVDPRISIPLPNTPLLGPLSVSLGTIERTTDFAPPAYARWCSILTSQELSALPAQVRIDLTGQTPPRPQDPDFKDPAHLRIAWQGGQGGTPDLLSLSASFRHPMVGSDYFSWFVALPPDATGELRMPTVPAALKAEGFAPGTDLQSFSLGRYDLAALSGYGDALKALDNDAWKVVGNQVCGLNRNL